MRARFLIATAVIASLVHMPVRAEFASASAFTGELQAKYFNTLWMQTCFKHFDEQSNLLKKLDSESQFRKNPHYASQILGDNKGIVWDASNERVEQAVTVYTRDKTIGRRCQAQIKHANVKTVRERFEDAVPKIINAGTELHRSSRTENINGIVYQSVSFRLHRRGNIAVPYFVMMTSDDAAARWQAIMITGVDASYTAK